MPLAVPLQASGNEPTRTFVWPCGTSSMSTSSPHRVPLPSAHAGERGGGAASSIVRIGQSCTALPLPRRNSGKLERLKAAAQVRSHVRGVLSAHAGQLAAVGLTWHRRPRRTSSKEEERFAVSLITRLMFARLVGSTPNHPALGGTGCGPRGGIGCGGQRPSSCIGAMVG